MCELKQFGKIIIRDEIAHFKIDLKSREQPKIRQSKINSRSVAGPMGQMNRQPSV
mgnify:CR=1 FL=1